jgi:hypothetical protein
MKKQLRRLAAVGSWCVLLSAFGADALAADPTFSHASFPVGDGPHSIADADFNRDGRADVATADVGSDRVSILLGDGAGSYVPAGAIPVGDEPHGLAVGDFDRDGRVDLAVADTVSNRISILLGNGAGGFAPAPGTPVAVAPNPWYVAVEDLNRDGRQDLAITHAGVTVVGGVQVFGQELTVLLGEGQGRFRQAPGSPMRVGVIPYGVAIADLNGDHKLDLAVANQFSSTIAILLGRGDGTFVSTPGPPVPPTSAPSWIATEDYDADGDIDLAVTLKGASTVAIFRGDGAGGFVPGSLNPVGRGPTAVAASDLNGDGRYDLAVSDQFDDTVSVLVGNGDGTFRQAAGSPVPVGENPIALTVTGANADGRLDLAVANFGPFFGTTPMPGSVSLLLNGASKDRLACRVLDRGIEVLDLAVPFSPWAVQLAVQRLNALKRAVRCGV